MAKINLLPWRENLQELRKKVFAAIFAASIALGVLILIFIDSLIKNSIEKQQHRNHYLKNEIALLEKKNRGYKRYQDQKNVAVRTHGCHQRLAGNRPVIVQVFDQLARIVPEGIYFKKMDVKDDLFTLVGIAESNNRVARLMRQLDASPWFTNPNLTAVRKVIDDGERLNEFDLNFMKVHPDHTGAE